MSFKFPLATVTWDQAEIDAMQSVIASGNFTMGERVANFERQFAEYIGSKYAVMSNSGSSANLLMVAALFFTKDSPLRPGDEVIVPAVSWSTTYFPLQQYGLRLRFVDIDLETLNYDLTQLSKAITTKTRLLMVVNLLGNPNDFTRIHLIIKNKNIRIIEDNCESLGSEYNGQKSGTFGEMGSFSSFFSHHISTMEGGLTVTNNEELYQILICLRAHGWTRNLPAINHISNKNVKDSFAESFRFVLPGYNLRPLELSGAIGSQQLKKLPTLVAERRKNAEYFVEKMSNHPVLMIQKEIGKSSWFGFSLIIKRDADIDRNHLIKKLQHVGFECRPIVAGNFARSSVLKFFDYEVFGDLCNADLVDKFGLFVGNHHYPITEAIDALSRI
jgi:CDP-6-deoxy-D-xylo-4-hexulose-3-dehydrase